jgi:hypothetical protein
LHGHGRLHGLGHSVVCVVCRKDVGRQGLRDRHDVRTGTRFRFLFRCRRADQRERTAGDRDGGGTPPQRGWYGPQRARARSSSVAGGHHERVLVRASAPGGAMPSHVLPSGSTVR